MKRFLKVAAVVVLLLLVAAAGGALFVWRGMKAVPGFYSRPALAGEERLRAIESFDRKILNLQSSLDQAFVRANLPGAQSPATQPVPESQDPVLIAAEENRPLTVTFSGAELDTYFAKWLQDSGYSQRMERYMTDPRVAVGDGRVILAGQMPDFDAVVSLYFIPSVDESGTVHLRLESVYAGRIPLPASAFDRFRQRAAEALEERTPRLRTSADISEEGFANEEAILLATQQQLAQLIEGRDVEQVVIFLPLPARGSVPARITTMQVDGEDLTVGVQLMDRQERARFLEELRNTGPTSDSPVAAGTR